MNFDLSAIFFNFLNGVIGAILLWVLQLSIRGYRRHRLEKKYPISGDYLSTYEDEDSGEKYFIEAPLHLSQKGRNITGRTEFDGRVWILEGEISNDGYLFGIYHAESVHDKGVGNFFLEIGISGDMEGLWSGYDSINKNITCGRYAFVRKPNFKIGKVTKKNVSAVLSIAEKELGAAYINVDDLLAEGNIAVYASVEGNIVGFSTAKKISTSEVYEKIPQLRGKKLRQIETAENIGLLASVATDLGWSGKGIGSALVEYCIKALEESGLNVIIMTGWKSGKGVHIGSVAKCHGFSQIMEIPEFWKEDSVENKYDCPHCGHPPCTCSAVVYVRHSKDMLT